MEINHLIAKYLMGKSSQKEMEELLSWEKEAKDNLHAIQEIKNSWDAMDEIKEYQEFETEMAWDDISQKIDQEIEPSAKIMRPKFNWSYVVAACMIFLVGVFVVPQFIGSDTDVNKHFTTIENDLQLNTPDGSWINLGINSELLVGEFNDSRNVDLTGQAFFKVESNPQKPFVVNTHNGSVEVLGTQFSVISKNNQFEVFVTEGSVAVSFNDRKIVLDAGDACELVDGVLAKYKMHDVNYLSWHDKKLVFENASLKDVKSALERHYGVTIKLNSRALTNQCKINTVYNNQKFSDILTELEKVFNLKYSKDGSIYKFDSIKC